MQRDERVYLSDSLEACRAIEDVMSGVDLAAHRADRLVRSAVEREFTIIGDAVAVLWRVAPLLVARITQAERSGDFRNQLTHEYPAVDDAVGWLVAEHDVPGLRRECSA